ncbi:MAG: translation initiation factor IF-6 [Nanoarchaeota archaeon]
MVHVYRTNFSGNPNVGLFAFATDRFCLVGASVTDENVSQLEEVLGVPVHRITIAGTSLVGVFVSGTADKILVPSIIFEHELKELKELGIDYAVIETTLTALGNNVVVNAKAALVNSDMEKAAIDAISSALGVCVEKGRIYDQDTVGSCLCLTSRGGIIHRDASDQQIDAFSDLFGVTIDIGTVNHGVPQVSSGIIANKNGFLIGRQSTGIEVSNVDELLGFLGDDDGQ